MKRVAVGRQVLENYLSKLFKVHSRSANIIERPNFSGRRLLLALVTAFVIGLSLMATMAESVWAAIELAYYRAAATNNAVFLEWATVREFNINGFEILCKRVNDPETAFHPIGSRIALGNANAGATYNFDVTSGLVPGERYCFRLREITNDLTPGEAFDLCGYGLGLTPPPTPIAPVSVVVSIPVTLTPTIVAVTAVPGLPTAPPVLPTEFPPPPQPESFVPTPDPALQQQQFDPNQPISPLTTSGDLQAPLDNAGAAGVQLPPTEMPMEEPMATFMPIEEPTAMATITPTVELSTTGDSGSLAATDPNALPVIPDNAAPVAMVEATPTPLYVVVTATPTPLPALVVAPTFTPWPTAVPTETFSFANMLVPNTQNLMVGLLCLIFLSASGLGALGLVTSVLYMRSQSRRDRLPGPTYERRRY